MTKLSVLLASLMISVASFNVYAADTMTPQQKTRAEVLEELKMAIKSGDLIEPFTHKPYKEIYPKRYPMSDSDAEKMAKEMMKDVPMMKK